MKKYDAINQNAPATKKDLFDNFYFYVLAIVNNITRRYPATKNYLEYQDLRTIAYIILTEAWSKFDDRKKTAFNKYLALYVKNYIRTYIRDLLFDKENYTPIAILSEENLDVICANNSSWKYDPNKYLEMNEINELIDKSLQKYSKKQQKILRQIINSHTIKEISTNLKHSRRKIQYLKSSFYRDLSSYLSKSACINFV